MSQQYASQQPAGFKNHLENVAIIGAGGNVGSHIARALIAQGKVRVTAVSRPDSSAALPEGLHAVKRVDNSDHAALVDALRGQDALVITLGVTAAADQQRKIVDAAIAAGVQYIMPNEYGADYDNAALGKDVLLGETAVAMRRHIEAAGGARTHWLALSCSFWYEYSLAGSEVRYGFDFGRKTLTLFDAGTTKICTSTWLQCGRAVAALFALPLLPVDAQDTQLTLSRWANRAAYIASFVVSQRDMLASVLRVTGGKEADWTITSEPCEPRYRRGVEMLQSGDRTGFGLLLYTRTFYPTGDGDYSHRLENNLLQLPEEDLDEATKEAIRMYEVDSGKKFS